MEVAASRYVFETSPELEHDRVARKEVSFRVNISEQQFRNYLSQLYSPLSEDILWYSNGQPVRISSSKKLSEEISRLCDQCYHRCPRLGNEMVNYDKLSSAAARARRELVEAMATKEEQESLGLTGFGPEVAAYRSILLADGLHIKDQDGWRLNLSYENNRLAALWNQIDECITNTGEKGVSVAAILNILQQPPFGLRQGPAPIYICLYILVNADDIAVFREGSYIPYLTEGSIALLLKRPDLFTLKHFISTGIEQKVFNIYRKLINIANLEGNVKLRNATMLGVVGPLVKYIEALPPYSRNTREISLEAQRIRAAIMNSSEPLQLLFEDIPLAVGIDLNEKQKEANWQEELQIRLRKALNELDQAYPKLNLRVQQALLEIFNHFDIEQLKEIQVKRISPLVEVCSDSELKPILQSMIRPAANPSEWVKGIAGIVVKKPVDSWNDKDFIPFVAKLRDYADRIEQLEALSALGSDSANDNIVLSIMGSNGKLKREVLSRSHKKDVLVDAKIKEILALPKDEARQIMLALISSLLEEGAEDHE